MANYKINPEAVSGKPMRSERFFNLFFEKFPSLFLANLFFLPFNLVSIGIAALTYKLFGGLNIVAAAAVLPILNIGMSGVALICRYVCEGKDFSVFSAYKKGLKENAPRFVLHGLIFYAAFAVSWFSVTLYLNGTSSSALFWVPLVITALISLAFLFASYYMNVMTVTMDISLKDTYRNCALFSFGELKNNIFVTIGLLILSAVVFSIFYIVNNAAAVLLILGLLQLFIFPSLIQYIITFYIFDDMVAILDESRKKVRSDDEEDRTSRQPKLEREEAEDISRLTEGSRDEYIFYNGRMIKRSEVESMLESSNENTDE